MPGLPHIKISARTQTGRDDASSVHERIGHLASEIDRLWKSQGRSEDLFPDIACEQLQILLEDHPLRSYELAHWTFSSHHSGNRSSHLAEHSQIELYHDGNFHIEATFWFRDLSEILDHEYVGVLALLEGQALRSEWEFLEHEMISNGLRRGELRCTGTALLRAGSMRAIRPGEPFIAQTMYLETTCVTLCIRTNSERPASCYRPPGIAFVRRAPSSARSRQFALLGRMPVKAVSIAAETCASQAILQGTPLDALEILSFMSANGSAPALLEEVCEQAKAIHGRSMDLLWRSVKFVTDQQALASIEMGRHEKHRLLLSLLLMMPDKAAMLSFLREEHPQDDPDELLWCWISEAGDTLGFDVGALSTFLLRGLFDGLDEDQIIDRLKEEYDSEDVEGLLDDIRGACQRLLGRPILQNLFADVTWKPEPGIPAFACTLDSNTLRYFPYQKRSSPLEPSIVKSLILNPDHYLQEGDELPEALKGCVPFAEKLAKGKLVLWVRDPATKCWMPYWFSERERPMLTTLLERPLDPAAFSDSSLRMIYDSRIAIAAGDADGRVEAWERALARARESYGNEGYAILPKLVNPIWIASLRKHYRKLRDVGAFNDGGEAAGKTAIYLDVATRFLQHQLVYALESVVSEKVQPSFCYTKFYDRGVALDRHIDRLNCVWNISIPFDLSPETEAAESWPLFVDCGESTAKIRLEMGDGALFSGVSAEHWREPQPEGHQSTFGFMLFAPLAFRGTLY